jgi:hypothetical protein
MNTLATQFREALKEGDCYGIVHYQDAMFKVPAYEVLKFTPGGGVFRQEDGEWESVGYTIVPSRCKFSNMLEIIDEADVPKRMAECHQASHEW